MNTKLATSRMRTGQADYCKLNSLFIASLPSLIAGRDINATSERLLSSFSSIVSLVLLSYSFSLPVLGNQLLLLSDAVDWFLTPTARRFSKGSNHSLFVTLLIS